MSSLLLCFQYLMSVIFSSYYVKKTYFCLLMLCIKSTKSLGTAKSRQHPIQREALQKYRVRNVPSPKEVIKKKLEAHGLEIYPLSWLGCRRNRTTCLLPPPWPSHPTQFWAGSMGRIQLCSWAALHCLVHCTVQQPWQLPQACSLHFFFSLHMDHAKRFKTTRVSSSVSATFSKGSMWVKQNISTKTGTLFIPLGVMPHILQD